MVLEGYQTYYVVNLTNRLSLLRASTNQNAFSFSQMRYRLLKIVIIFFLVSPALSGNNGFTNRSFKQDSIRMSAREQRYSSSIPGDISPT